MSVALPNLVPSAHSGKAHCAFWKCRATWSPASSPEYPAHYLVPAGCQPFDLLESSRRSPQFSTHLTVCSTTLCLQYHKDHIPPAEFGSFESSLHRQGWKYADRSHDTPELNSYKSKTIWDLGLQRSPLNCTMNLSAQEQQSVWPLAHWKRMMLFTDEIEIQQKFRCISGITCKNWVIPNVNACHFSFISKAKEHLLFTEASLTVNKITLSRSRHLQEEIL